jgi:galactonate dehydratase
MQVTGYETFKVPPRWVFLRVDTDEGISGWGEPIVEGHSETVIVAVENIMDNYLLSRDPMEIERHWQAMYRGLHFRGGPILMSAIAGIDQALWDIKGKQCGLPVYELLGGKSRDRVRLYQWIGGDTPEELAAAATEAVENGYRTMKLPATAELRPIDSPDVVREAERRLGAVREAVGPEIDVAVDFRGRTTKSMARRLGSELDRYDPMFYEEPLLPEHYQHFPEVAEHTTTALSSGERFYSRWDFRPLLDRGGVDVVQPNPSHAGGITESKKIANAAAASDVSVTFHNPTGPIAFASCLQLALAVPNAIIQGQHLDVHALENNRLLSYLAETEGFDLTDGYISPPDAPGLGIDIDHGVVEERASDQLGWQSPIWYHPDGSVAEW